MSKGNDVPRRNDLDKMTHAEFAITAAIHAVEDAGADELLTKAVMLLSQARSLVADYVDAQGSAKVTWVPACVCGNPIEGHKPDEIHDHAVAPPTEHHTEQCQGNKWAVWVDIKSGRCLSCKRRISGPQTAKVISPTVGA